MTLDESPVAVKQNITQRDSGMPEFITDSDVAEEQQVEETTV